ncbi:hypothetical protein REH70_13285 [Cellulomonas sp. ATA003]|nr:hypothetical protein [Cellulomonas sp. ATA003]WNB84737.1 hypothetical protein REH70_13285 [Cellulomonas sp. ATA003]
MILAALGGWLTNLAFPDRGWWPLAYVGVALLLTALRSARAGRAAGTGLAWGLCFFLPHVDWAVDATGSVLPWIALSLFQASYVAGFAVLWAHAQRAPWVGDHALVQAATAAVVWVAVEQLRGSWPFGDSRGGIWRSPRRTRRRCDWRPTAVRSWSLPSWS